MKDVLKMEGSNDSQQWGRTKAIELYTLKLLKMLNFMWFKMYCWNISGNLYLFLWKLEKFCSGYPRSFSYFERNPVCSLLKPSKAVARGRAVATPIFPSPQVLRSAYRMPPLTAAPNSSNSLFEHFHSFCPQDWGMSSSSILLGCLPTCLSLCLNYIQVRFLPSSDICQPPSLASHPWKTNPKMKHKQVLLHFIPLALNLTTPS